MQKDSLNVPNLRRRGSPALVSLMMSPTNYCQSVPWKVFTWNLWNASHSICTRHSSHHRIRLLSTSCQGAWQEGHVPGSSIPDRVGEEQGPPLEVADHSSERWKTSAKPALAVVAVVVKIADWLGGKKNNAGALQLLQLQEEACRQSAKDGGAATEKDVDLQMRLNKDLMMSSIWKLNVVDIEVTLLHVCEMVCVFTEISCKFITVVDNNKKNSKKGA